MFLDLASYVIVSENNAAQYYPDYAFNHPLFTDGMKIFSEPNIRFMDKNGYDFIIMVNGCKDIVNKLIIEKRELLKMSGSTPYHTIM